MSEDDADDRAGLAPHETSVLFGHADAERSLLESYKSGRIPHAWLIGGVPGIGKATLAYRMARFVLAHPDPAAAQVQAATSLAVDPASATARRIANEASTGLLVLQRIVNEKTGKLFTEIRVDEVRRAVPFFGSTAGEGGWRVAIIDSLDDLNAAGENSLLKVLEEPPARSLLLLISSAPGRVLPTIRSRCRRLLLRPLDSADVARAVAATTDHSDDVTEVRQAAETAEGSVARALSLLDNKALALRQRVLDLFAQLPNPDPRLLHALGDALGGNEPQTLENFVDLINGWLTARLHDDGQETRRMARLAQVSAKVNRAALDASAYNLERKPLVFAVFGLLSEVARA